MTNEEYVNSKPLDTESRRVMLEAMAKYGDNQWWLSEDLKTIGYYQLREDILLVDFDRFHKGVEALLIRPVWTHEFGLCRQGLLEESEKAWNGDKGTIKDRRDAIKRGFAEVSKHMEIIPVIIGGDTP